MTTEMSQVLANAYGTTQAGSQEQMDKVAVANAIAKLAAADNLDLNALDENQLSVVYTHYVEKLAAGEAPPFIEEKKDEEKKDEKGEEKGNGVPPELNDEEKKAAAELQEADFLGRQMAHSFVNELGEIQKAAAVQQAAPEAPAEEPQAEVPEVIAKLAQARALQFLQEKVAAGQLCICGSPQCNGSCETAKTAAAGQPEQPAPTQDQLVDHYAAQMLQSQGYGHLLNQQ